MLNIAIGARKVGRYRVEDARPTDGVVARSGVAAGTTTGVVVGGRHRATLVRWASLSKAVDVSRIGGAGNRQAS